MFTYSGERDDQFFLLTMYPAELKSHSRGTDVYSSRHNSMTKLKNAFWRYLLMCYVCIFNVVLRSTFVVSGFQYFFLLHCLFCILCCILV